VVTAAGVLALSIGLFGWALWQRDLTGARAEPAEVTVPVERATPPPAPEPADLLFLTDVLTDEEGRLTRVDGPNPGAVLLAFCEASPSAGQLEPIGLAAAVPPFPGSRLGLFRDFEQNGSIRTFAIRKDRRTGRWAAGNGRAPIITREVDEVPPGTREVAASG